MPHQEEYIPYSNVEEAVKYFTEKVTANFEFLNLQKQTGIHEVDIKRYD